MPGNFEMKLPLRCFLPTVFCLPPYSDVLGKLTLIGVVADCLPELGGPQGMPELGGLGVKFGLPVG